MPCQQYVQFCTVEMLRARPVLAWQVVVQREHHAALVKYIKDKHSFSQLNKYLQGFFKRKKICVLGVCTKNSTFSSDTCLYQDDQLITSLYFGTVFQTQLGFSFPSTQMSCQQILDYVTVTLKQAANVYCENSFFQQMCCNACKSNLKNSILTNKQFFLKSFTKQI